MGKERGDSLHVVVDEIGKMLCRVNKRSYDRKSQDPSADGEESEKRMGKDRGKEKNRG